MTEVVHVPGRTAETLATAPWAAPMEPYTDSLPYDLAVTDGGVPDRELATITAPVLIIGGGDSPAWFRRSVAEQAKAIPGAQLRTLDGLGHNAPPELVSSIMTDFFSAAR